MRRGAPVAAGAFPSLVALSGTAGSAATVGPSAPSCDLVRSKQAEFGSCVLVTASVAKTPKVGETGTLTVNSRAATGIAVRGSNRLAGWVAPTASVSWPESSLSRGTATSVPTVNPRPGYNAKIMWFRPTTSTTAVLLLGLPADTGSSTAERCVSVVVR